MIGLDIERSEIDSAVGEAKHRARSYHQIDGLATISSAIGFLLISLCTLWLTQRGFTWNTWRVVGLMVIVSSLWDRVASRLVRWLRFRITYPRIGYVSLPKATSDEIRKLQEENRERHPETLVWFMWVGFAASSLAFQPHPWFDIGVLTVGLFILWYKTRWKFPFAGLLIPGLWFNGLLMAFLRIPGNYRVCYMLAAVAIFYSVKGTIQFVRYLRWHPAPQGASVGGEQI